MKLATKRIKKDGYCQAIIYKMVNGVKKQVYELYAFDMNQLDIEIEQTLKKL